MELARSENLTFILSLGAGKKNFIYQRKLSISILLICFKVNLQHDVFLTTGEFEPRSSSPSQLADRHRPGVVSSSGMSVVLLC